MQAMCRMVTCEIKLGCEQEIPTMYMQNVRPCVLVLGCIETDVCKEIRTYFAASLDIYNIVALLTIF